MKRQCIITLGDYKLVYDKYKGFGTYYRYMIHIYDKHSLIHYVPFINELSKKQCQDYLEQIIRGSR